MAGRVLGFIALAAAIGVAIGLAFHRVLLGVLVTAGILILGLLLAISKSKPQQL
jgi:hypothetical protein